MPPATETGARRRSTPTAVAVGLAAAVAVGAVVACLLTIPLFAMARFTEPAHGTGRAWFTTGLRWAFVLGAVTGVVGGALTGRWYALGARWPTPPATDQEET